MGWCSGVKQEVWLTHDPLDHSAQSTFSKPGKNRDGVVRPSKLSTFVEVKNAITVDRQKTESEKEIIDKAFMQHFFFAQLTTDLKQELVEKMKLYVLEAEDTVFQQGSPGTNFYVLTQGQANMQSNGKFVKTLELGDSFGELALIKNAPRSATIVAVGKLHLWGLDRLTFQQTLQTLNVMNYEENRGFVESIPLLAMLTPNQKDGIISNLITGNYKPGTAIVNEGQIGDLLYIIKEGRVICTKDDRELREMGKGDFFGEQSLLYNCERTATIRAINDVICLSLDRTTLQNTLGSQLQHVIYKNSIKIACEKSEALVSLTKPQVEAATRLMSIKTYEDGEVIIQRGTPINEAIWLVLRGNLISGSQPFAKTFACIGEGYNQSDWPDSFQWDVKAEGDTDIAWITAEDFENCIGGNFADVMMKNEALSALKHVQLLKSLSIEKFGQIIEKMQIQEYEPGTKIVEQGEEGSTFYILREGKVDFYVGKKRIRTACRFDYFGERSILLNQMRSATAVAIEKVVCWQLTQVDFLSIVDKDIQKLIIDRIELQDDSITLDELRPIQNLGQGMFGNVVLCGNIKNDNKYALKTVSRRKIGAYGLSESLIAERQILMTIDHSFIMKLIKTFKDENRVYFLTEYVHGADLFDVLRKLNICSDAQSRFYCGIFILILEHLQERHIIHRDLKPENVMIDEVGYPKLIDFGTAKIVTSRTFTIVGTPHYMAPEVILGKGYGASADLWSLGIMLYEFRCGGVPFGEEMNDSYKVYEAILSWDIEYPMTINKKSPIVNLIDTLLSRNPGARSDPVSLKSHRFFNKFVWEDLVHKKIRAPWMDPMNKLNKSYQNETIYELLTQNESNESKMKVKKPPPSDWDRDF